MFKIFCFSLLFGSILFTACKKELSLREPGALVLKTVDQDASLPSILVAGTQFHAETFGNPNDPIIDLTWSPDSRWLAYVASATNGYPQIHLYQAAEGAKAVVTSDLAPEGRVPGISHEALDVTDAAALADKAAASR